MNRVFTYGAALSFCAFSLFTVNWFMESAIEAGLLLPASLTLLSASIGLGLFVVYHRAQCRREAAREARWQAFEDRSRRAEEREAWYRERSSWQ